MPEGKEEEQEIENLFERIMKENFPGKENKVPGSPESSESPKEVKPKEEYSKTHHN